MNINLKVAIPALLVFAFIAYGAYDLSLSLQDKNFLEVEAKMADGSVVDITDETLHATIGETYGITEIRFTINVKNTGTIPLSVNIESSTPEALSNSLIGSISKQAASGDTVSWTTNWIAIAPFIGTTPSFDVVASATDSLGRSVMKSDSISFAIMPDPEIGIDVSITSGSSEGSGTDPGDDDGTSCSDECTFYEQQCYNGHVYDCVVGVDGCRDLILVENCGTGGCSGGQCMSSSACTETTYSVERNALGGCIFDCTQSYEDCDAFYNTGFYSNQGPTYLTIPKGEIVSRGPCYNCRITKCV